MHDSSPTYLIPEDATVLFPDGTEPAPPTPPSCPCGGDRCFYDGLTIAAWNHDR